MRYIVVGVMALSLILGLRYASLAESPPSPISIHQVQVSGGTGLASNEFIELGNMATMPLSLDHWQIQYRSAAASGDCTSGWTTKLTLVSAVIAAGGTYVVSSNGYLDQADGHFAAGLADTKGALRLLDASGVIIDSLAWGGATCGRGTAAPVPGGGSSLMRHAATGDNAADFMLTNPSTPHPARLATPIDYPILALTEIAPQAVGDTAPFVELYNANEIAVETSAYCLTMSTGTYHLLPGQIEAGGYLVIDPSSLGLTMAPSDQVTLSDPSGRSLDRSDIWPAPPGDSSWALLDDGWGWTNQPTPGAANLASAPIATVIAGPVVDTTPIEITELLPNPSLVGEAQRNKFVELHNAGTTTVILRGFSLRSGPSWGNHVLLPDLSLAPGEYRSLPATTTPLSLAVGGGRVGLFDAAGNLIGEPAVYGRSIVGQAYARFDDGWHWTTFATPGAANILIAAPASTTVKTAAPKKTTPKAAPKPKVAKPKTTKPKTGKLSTAATTLPLSAGSPVAGLPLGWLLLGLAGLTMAYVIYEFRYDLNHLYQLGRRHLEARRASRKNPPGRRGPGGSE